VACGVTGRSSGARRTLRYLLKDPPQSQRAKSPVSNPLRIAGRIQQIVTRIIVSSPGRVNVRRRTKRRRVIGLTPNHPPVFAHRAPRASCVTCGAASHLQKMHFRMVANQEVIPASLQRAVCTRSQNWRSNTHKRGPLTTCRVCSTSGGTNDTRCVRHPDRPPSLRNALTGQKRHDNLPPITFPAALRAGSKRFAPLERSCHRPPPPSGPLHSRAAPLPGAGRQQRPQPGRSFVKNPRLRLTGTRRTSRTPLVRRRQRPCSRARVNSAARFPHVPTTHPQSSPKPRKRQHVLKNSVPILCKYLRQK